MANTIKLLHISKENSNSVAWRIMGNYQFSQWELQLRTISNKTLNNLIKFHAITVSNLATSLDIAVTEQKTNRSKEMMFRSTAQNFRHPKHLRLFFIANGQVILQKSAGVVLMQLIDLNGSNKTNQQKTQKKDKNKENRPIQDL